MDSTRLATINAAAHAAFEAAVAVLGSQEAMARLLGKTQGAISKRLASRKGVWSEDALVVEAATGISRHALRPDLYPDEANAGTAALDHAARTSAAPFREIAP